MESVTHQEGAYSSERRRGSNSNCSPKQGRNKLSCNYNGYCNCINQSSTSAGRQACAASCRCADSWLLGNPPSAHRREGRCARSPRPPWSMVRLTQHHRKNPRRRAAGSQVGITRDTERFLAVQGIPLGIAVHALYLAFRFAGVGLTVEPCRSEISPVVQFIH